MPLLTASIAISQESGSSPTYRLFWENDFFAPFQKDRWYSNGFGISRSSVAGFWAARHAMYTPQDKRAERVLESDRPYSGEFSLVHLRALPGVLEDDPNRGVLAGGRVGCVGPCAKAKRLQKFVHNDLEFGTDPRGWGNENGSEPILDLIVYYRSETRGRSFFGAPITELTTWGAEAGNANVRSWLKVGIEPGINESWFLLGETEGAFVLHNTHVDGRVFRENTHTRESTLFQAAARGGIGWRGRGYEVTYSYSYLSDQFEGQEGRHLFGGLSIGFSF
jgi:hypothetical protein